mgnify:FL=1|jgi:FtsH-binding integral membrane protein|tara:strand:- start:34 stop:804 length:771 start_codon:yes stop_codon:yes gene_type:complete
MENLFQRFSNPPSFNIQKILKFNDVKPSTQRHLKNVYTTLFAGVVAAAFGAYIHLMFHVGGLLTCIATAFTLGYLGTTRNENIYDNAVFQKRLGIFLGFCALKGMSIGSLVESSLYLDPAIPLIAFIGTVIVFGCFSFSALVAKRRSYLYISGFLSSAMSLMFFMSLANIFFQSSAMYNVQIYVGLVLFSGYVIVDTQMIVEKAENGEKDYLWHAAELFTDFVAIFIRILIILMRNARRNGGRRRDEDDRRRRNRW